MEIDMNTEILRILTNDEVLKLKELYLRKYGENNYHYLLLYNQCKWNEKLLQLSVTTDTEEKWKPFRKYFYTHRNGNLEANGTYISLHYDLVQSLSFHTWEHGAKEVLECLKQTRLIKWQNGPLLTNVDLQFCEQIKRIAFEKGVTECIARTCSFLVLSTEKALSLPKPRLDSKFKLAPLCQQQVPMIHELWSNKKEGSMQYLLGLLKLNKHWGIYHVENNELVAWIYQNDFAGIGMLETTPALQRRGLAKILVTQISKQIVQEEGIPVSAWIKKENAKSSALLTNLRYERIIDAQWIQCKNI